MPARVPIPGFLTVKGAGEQLGLAPRSVRDLIYAGRLPSVRLGRTHFITTADVELERRRRLGLPLPKRAVRPPRPRREGVAMVPTRRPAQDSATRKERASARAALVERWLRSGHVPSLPVLPFTVVSSFGPAHCDACQRAIAPSRRAVQFTAPEGETSRLCLTCARRAVLHWADERRRESMAARRFAADLGFVPPADVARAS